MRIVIIVDDGFVQDVLTDGDGDIKAVLRDWDNINEGGYDEMIPVVVEPTIVEDIFAGIEDE